MNLCKISVYSFLILGLLFFTRVDAATPTPTTAPTVAKPTTSTNAVLVADVDIYNAKIISQEGNKFKISFTLANGKGVQNGVKYGVNLVKIIDKAQYLVDEKVYDDLIDLVENTKIDKEIEYTAPSFMSGLYKIVLTAKNESGFPFAIAKAGDLTLKGTSNGIEILTETCFLQVVGEKPSKSYRLTQGVDIKKEENISLNCMAINAAKEEKVAIPLYQTRYRSSYGEIVPQEGGDLSPITFKAGEKKNISLVLPKAINPQSYNVEFNLTSQTEKSNSIAIHYVLRGASSTIQNISLDKNYYQNGETANVKFFQTLSADSFPGSRFGNDTTSVITSKIELSNGNDKVCANPVTKIIDYNASPMIDVVIPVTSDCLDPHVIVTTTDENGIVMDKKEFNIKSVIEPKAEKNNNFMLMVIIAVVAIIGLLYLKFKKKNNLSSDLPISILFVLFTFGMISLIPINQAEAKSFTLGTIGQGDAVTFVVGIDKEIYEPGEYVSMDGTMYMAGCGNTPIDATLDGTIGEETVNLIDAVDFSKFSTAGGDQFISGGYYLPAPARENTYLGEFIVTFTGSARNHFNPESGNFYKSNFNILAYLTPLVTPPEPLSVEVFVDGVKNPDPIEKNKSVKVTWEPKNATECQCVKLDMNGKEIGKCGTGVAPIVKSSPVEIEITQKTTFRVDCTDEIKSTPINPQPAVTPKAQPQPISTANHVSDQQLANFEFNFPGYQNQVNIGVCLDKPAVQDEYFDISFVLQGYNLAQIEGTGTTLVAKGNTCGSENVGSVPQENSAAGYGVSSKCIKPANNKITIDSSLRCN